MTYDVFVEVSGWVKIGQVDAEDRERALALAPALDRETLFNPSEVVDMLEISHPLSFEADES